MKTGKDRKQSVKAIDCTSGSNCPRGKRVSKMRIAQRSTVEFGIAILGRLLLIPFKNSLGESLYDLSKDYVSS